MKTEITVVVNERKADILGAEKIKEIPATYFFLITIG